MDEKLQEVKRTPEEAEALLLSLVGTWEGTNRTWFNPGELADTSPIRGTIRPLPGASFVLYEYESSLSGENPFKGIMFIGYNIFSSRFEFAWADSNHQRAHMLFAEGPGLEKGFSVLGSYLYDASKPAWGWRTQVELLEADHLIVTAFNISPQGAEAKGIEADYRRVTG